MADANSRAAANGSVEPNTEEITAMPTAPASIAERALDAVIPPIATIGSPIAAESLANSTKPIAAPASILELVKNTGPTPA